MKSTDASISEIYDDHYASKDPIDQEWTKLASFARLDHTLKVIGDRKFNSTIDVGAGDGMALQRLSESEQFGTLNAVEISEAAVRIIKSLPIPKLGEVKQFDGYSIPFDSNHFDLASCFHVIEHVENPRALLREIARVSQYQVFEIPLDYRPGIDAKVDFLMSYGHIAVYTPSLFRFLLRSEGFEIITDYVGDLSWQAQEFMILHSKKTQNKQIRLLKAHLSNIKRMFKRAFSSRQFNLEFSYSTYTCFCEFKGKPIIEYSQTDLW